MIGDHDKYHGTAEVPKRDWVRLTDDDINEMIVDVWLKRNRYAESDELRWFAGLIEAKLKEKKRMKTKIHVNQHNVRANSKGEDLPVLTVKTYKENRKCNKVEIRGPSSVVYSPDKPLSCGAKVWIETEAEVICKK